MLPMVTPLSMQASLALLWLVKVISARVRIAGQLALFYKLQRGMSVQLRIGTSMKIERRDSIV